METINIIWKNQRGTIRLSHTQPTPNMMEASKLMQSLEVFLNEHDAIIEGLTLLKKIVTHRSKIFIPETNEIDLMAWTNRATTILDKLDGMGLDMIYNHAYSNDERKGVKT